MIFKRCIFVREDCSQLIEFLRLSFQDLARDIKQHTPNHDDVNSTTNKHLDACKKEPVDEPVAQQGQVQQQLENHNNRWDALNAQTDENTKQLENVEKEVEKMVESERDLNVLFKEVENSLDNQKPIHVNPAKCQSNLDFIKVSFYF